MIEKTARKIHTVASLTREIKTLLEESFSFVWVCGEISNYALPSSGHSYFTLKDSDAVISCVMFRNQRSGLKFQPGNGMRVFGLARLSVYAPRGNYQLIFEHLEPEGAGAMQLAFEQLKEKLSGKGYFDSARKKEIPFLSSQVCIITSITGAAVRDILQVAKRRFENCCINILPVQVQGDAAPEQICDAIKFAGTELSPDLIILARGGGSMEDLQAFNTESVAQAIFESAIPVLTGIGHETDFTIADFVADLRAPTPSAAAELTFPDKKELIRSVNSFQQRLSACIKKQLSQNKDKALQMAQRLKSPAMQVYQHQMRLEDLLFRLENAVKRFLAQHQTSTQSLTRALMAASPAADIRSARHKLQSLTHELQRQTENILQNKKAGLLELAPRLEALSPLNVLQRGYSITRVLPEKKLLTASHDVHPERLIEVILADGRLTAKVEQTYGQEKEF